MKITIISCNFSIPEICMYISIIPMKHNAEWQVHEVSDNIQRNTCIWWYLWYVQHVRIIISICNFSIPETCIRQTYLLNHNAKNDSYIKKKIGNMQTNTWHFCERMQVMLTCVVYPSEHGNGENVMFSCTLYR